MDFDKPSARHALVRTSPKGELFRGRCVQCGATDLRPSADVCPNPEGKLLGDVLLELIGDKDTDNGTD